MANVKYSHMYDASSYRQIVTTRKVCRNEEILFFTNGVPAKESAAAYSDSIPSQKEADEIEKLMAEHSSLTSLLQNLKDNTKKVENDIDLTMQKMDSMMEKTSYPAKISSWQQSRYGYPAPAGFDKGRSGLVRAGQVLRI